MTWTCTGVCGKNVNPDDAQKCLNCGADRPTGVSDEERAAWEAYSLSLGAAGWGQADVRCKDAADHKKFRATFWKTSRAPLEAENAKLRAAIRDLEHQRDNHQQAHGTLAERFERIRAQLAQQKPAPGGLPEFKECIEVRLQSCDGNGYRPWEFAHIMKHWDHRMFDCQLVNGGICTRNVVDEGETWRRLPPAQAGRKVQAGDTVFTVYLGNDGVPFPYSSNTPKRKTKVSSVDGEEFILDGFGMPRRVSDLGKTWWWNDPGAKGEG